MGRNNETYDREWEAQSLMALANEVEDDTVVCFIGDQTFTKFELTVLGVITKAKRAGLL